MVQVWCICVLVVALIDSMEWVKFGMSDHVQSILCLAWHFDRQSLKNYNCHCTGPDLPGLSHSYLHTAKAGSGKGLEMRLDSPHNAGNICLKLCLLFSIFLFICGPLLPAVRPSTVGGKRSCPRGWQTTTMAYPWEKSESLGLVSDLMASWYVGGASPTIDRVFS